MRYTQAAKVDVKVFLLSIACATPASPDRSHGGCNLDSLRYLIFTLMKVSLPLTQVTVESDGSLELHNVSID